MRLYTASAGNLFLGLYNRLAVVGVGMAANGASDFTDADTSQVLNLQALDLGDGLDYPLARVICKQAPAGTGLSNVQIKVGHTDDDDAAIAQAALIIKGNSISAIGPAAAAGGPNNVTAASKFVTATFDTTGANLNALTAGIYFIYYNLFDASQAIEPVA